MRRIISQVLSNPDKVVSFSELEKCGFFKKLIKHAQFNGKRLMEQVANEMDNLQLGEIRRFTVARNSCQVKSHLPLYGFIIRLPHYYSRFIDTYAELNAPSLYENNNANSLPAWQCYQYYPVHQIG